MLLPLPTSLLYKDWIAYSLSTFQLFKSTLISSNLIAYKLFLFCTGLSMIKPNLYFGNIEIMWKTWNGQYHIARSWINTKWLISYNLLKYHQDWSHLDYLLFTLANSDVINVALLIDPLLPCLNQRHHCHSHFGKNLYMSQLISNPRILCVWYHSKISLARIILNYWCFHIQ